MLKAVLGLGDCAEGGEAWRRWVLDHFVLTLVPDANPGGSRRAPVKFWDGSEISNERFYFRSFFELDQLHDYEVWLDLHQTEFIGSDRNTEVHLPTCQDELPEAMATRHRELGEAIHARWRTATLCGNLKSQAATGHQK